MLIILETIFFNFVQITLEFIKIYLTLSYDFCAFLIQFIDHNFLKIENLLQIFFSKVNSFLIINSIEEFLAFADFDNEIENSLSENDIEKLDFIQYKRHNGTYVKPKTFSDYLQEEKEFSEYKENKIKNVTYISYFLFENDFIFVLAENYLIFFLISLLFFILIFNNNQKKNNPILVNFSAKIGLFFFSFNLFY